MARVDHESGSGEKRAKENSSSYRLLVVLCGILTVCSISMASFIAYNRSWSQSSLSSTSSNTVLHHSQSINVENGQTLQKEFDDVIAESRKDVSEYLENDDDDLDKPNVCLTPTCVITASNILQSMNTSVDPCENFYDYACGKWASNQDVPENTGHYGVFNKLNKLVNKRVIKLITGETHSVTTAKSAKKVVKLYKSCMDTDQINKVGADRLKKVMKSLKGYPMLEDKWDGSNVDVFDLSIELRKLNAQTLFSQYVMLDRKERVHLRLNLDQVYLMIGTKDDVKRLKKNDIIRYTSFLANVSIALGAKPEVAVKDVDDVFAFEKKLALIGEGFWTRIFKNPYKKFEFSQLKTNLTGTFDFESYFNKQLAYVGKPNIKDDDIVISYARIGYFADLVKLIAATPKRVVVNQMMLTLITNTVGLLGKPYTDYIDVMNRKKHKDIPRKKMCLYSANQSMKWAVSRMFVDKYFDPSAKKTSLNMIENVRNEFIRMLRKEPWMDAASKKVAIEKARGIKERIGYPDSLLDDDVLDKLYNNMEFEENTFIKNIYSILNNLYIQNLLRMDKKEDDIWSLPPTMVNAFYEPLKNRISFPAAILQAPFYHKDYPKYLNYAGIGFVIGHEITHGFDSRGRRYDKDGKIRNWWSDEVVKSFNERAQCYVNQYDKFLVSGWGHVNGKKTLNENIADNGGLKESFGAYRKYVEETLDDDDEEEVLPALNLSANQLFFLNTAQGWCGKFYSKEAWGPYMHDVHSPGKFRILGIMQNSPDFSKAYNCPVGSKMNPKTKCELW